MAEAQSAVRAIFDEASELEAGEPRRSYLDSACGDDAAVRDKVEELLRSHESAGEFLADPKREEPSAAGPVTETEGHRIGRYKLLQKIGEGGCGIVYMAEQTEPVKRRVALKIIKLGMDTRSVVARFEAERQALAMMDHPDIARVLDAGATDTGRPYFVMELVRGIKITDYCEQNRLSTPARLRLFIQVCQAVQHAHQKGIIHRDLKPSNILVTSNDGAPLPKVIDFGIVKATADIQLTDKTLFTRFEMFIGTPAYMSPEQAEFNAADIDTRTDIYALGVLLYELLTGKTPFDGNELMSRGIDAMRRTIRETEPPRPSTRLTRELAAAPISRRQSTQGLAVPTQEEIEADERRRRRLREQVALLRGDLDWIVLKAIDKVRSRRYETANGLAMDIQRYLANEPVVARPPSSVYRIQKAWQRHKVVFTSAALVALALVAGFGFSAWQAIRATRAQQAEEEQRRVAEAKEQEAEQARQLAEERQREAQRSEARAQRLLYGANLNLVQAAFEADNFLAAQRLLDDTATYADRGFEWHYWQHRMHREVLVFRGHATTVNGLAFSPDSERVASVDESGTLKIWNRATGAEIASGDVPNQGRTVAFSPDGMRVLSGGGSKMAGLMVSDARTGAPLVTNLQEFTGGAFSPDGRRIVAYNQSKAVIVDAESVNPLLGIFERLDPKGGVALARFSPNGRGLAAVIQRPDATGESDYFAEVRRWDVDTGDSLETAFQLPKVPRGWWDTFVFSPDFRWIVCGGWSGQNALVDLATGKPANESEEPGDPRHFKGHAGLVMTFAFSPDARYLLTGSDDKSARVWDIASLREVRQLRGHTEEVRAAAWSPDGRWLATGEGNDGAVRIWEAGDVPEQVIWRDVGQPIAVSSDGSRFWTGSNPTSPATLWDAATLRPIQTFEQSRRREGYHVIAVAISSDHRFVLNVTSDGNRTETHAWDAQSGGWLFLLDDPTETVSDSARFSPDSRFIVTAHRASRVANGAVCIWSAETGKLVRRFDHHSATVYDAVMSPDGRWLVTASSDSGSREGHDSRDAGIRIWDASDGREIRHLPGEASYRCEIASSPDGRHFAVALNPALVKVFELESGRELTTLVGHRDRTESLVYSPDGRRLLTASHDQTAKLWDAETGRELLTLKGHEKPVVEAGFLNQGSRIVTRSWDNTLRFWDAATPEEGVTR